MKPSPDESTGAVPSATAAAGALPAVSVVMPVLNEARHLRTAVRHILDQDYPGPIEVVIALGPCRDGTERIAAELAAGDARVRTVPNPSGKTPCALNAAVRASRHEIVVRVDGHGLLPPDYVRTAVDLLAETGADNVGGVMRAVGVTSFERAVAAAMTSPLGVGNARFHTGGEAGPADTVYLGAFRRATLDRLGGYDESFVRAQDWELNYRIRGAGGLVWFSPRLQVVYRPRPNVRALARQYFDYGRWRRVVMRQHRGSATARYLAPPAALLTILAGLVVGVVVHPLGFIAPGGYLLGVLVASILLGRRIGFRAAVFLPVVLATMHLSWGAGFLTSPAKLAPVAREASAPAGEQIGADS